MKNKAIKAALHAARIMRNGQGHVARRVKSGAVD